MRVIRLEARIVHALAGFERLPAFGQRQELEKLIAVRHGEEPSILNNNEIAPLISSANGSGVVWSAMGAAYTRFYMRPSYLANFLKIQNTAVREWVSRMDQRVNDRHSREEIADISRPVAC